MNPREFCEERGYPLALALSYSFDPLFFDRIVLPALWSGGTEEVLVLADGKEVDHALARVHGPIHHLGRRYLLAPVRRRGRFHPKMLLRLGHEGGIVAIGSGNLTHGGWGLNREVAAAWRVGPDLEDTGGWIPDLLERAIGWTGSRLAQRAVERMQDLPWLETGAAGPLLVSGPAPLALQLQERWPGRRFTTLRFTTGSTDTGGAVLRWFHEAFGVEHAVGCVTPSRCAFDADKLEELPLRLELVAHLAPIVHAKIYHLAGQDGDVFLVGSANCSPAAWLRPPADGGNVEMMLVYDAPARDTLAALDELLEEGGRPPADVLAGGYDEGEGTDRESAELVLQGFQIEEGGTLVARLSPELTGSWTCHAVVGDQAIPLRRSGAAWIGREPEQLPAGQSAFGHVEARVDSGRTILTGRRWIDDLRLLHESGSSRALALALANLPKPRSHQEDDQLLQELSRLTHDLTHRPDLLPDALARQRSREPELDDAQVVDSERLIRSLRDDPVRLTQSISRGDQRSVSFSGIFRALFGGDDDDDQAHEVLLDEDEPAPDQREGDPSARKLEDPPDTVAPPPVAERTRQRFERHLDRFMVGLRSPNFRSSCTATQLIHAVGYPYAATALGLERGWTDSERARPRLAESAALLLYGGARGQRPLLQEVAERYAAHDSEELYRQIVGEGTLWVTTLVGLSGLRWPDQRDAMHRLLLIRDLWNTEVLRACAEPEHLESLIRRYRAGDAVHAMRELAAPMAASLAELEGRLAALVDREPAVLEAGKRDPVAPDELLWGPRNGWAVALENESAGMSTKVYWFGEGREAPMRLDGHFLSVEQATKETEELLAAFKRVQSFFP